MSDRPLLLTSDGAVRVLTIDRQARRNAIDRATLQAFQGLLDQVAGDAAARVLVIAGAGEKAFVAGADITEFQGLSAEAARALARTGQHLMRRIETMGLPVVAAINGYALGGGCELALACTFRIMSTTARLGLPEVKLGLVPGFGGTQRMARLVGRQRALEWMLTGRQIEAAEAVAAGLVLRAVEPDRLMADVMAFAHQLAAGAPLAQSYILAAVDRGLELPIDAGCDLEASYFGLAASTADMREGVSAFLDKRAPAFTGR